MLAFTDGPQSPLAKSANLALPIPGKNLLFSHSLAAFGVLAHALAISLAREDPMISLKKLHAVQRVARPNFAKD